MLAVPLRSLPEAAVRRGTGSRPGAVRTADAATARSTANVSRTPPGQLPVGM